jgi:hypothetical protein
LRTWRLTWVVSRRDRVDFHRQTERFEDLVGLRGLAPRLLLHPKQAGRYLPLSPLWIKTSVHGVLHALTIFVPTLGLLGAHGAGDRRLERGAPDPVMDPEDAKQPGEPIKFRALNSPGRIDMRHRPIVHRILEGPVGVEPTLAGSQPTVPPQHFGPIRFGRRGWFRPIFFRLSTGCSSY